MPKGTHGLTQKQARFCEEYVIDGNATGAYSRAGYATKGAGAEVNASKLLRNPKVQAYIAELRAQQQYRTQVTGDLVIAELARVAFANITDVLDFNAREVRLKDSTTLAKEVTSAVASASEGHDGVKISMHSKTQALKILGQHLGLFSDFNTAIATLEKYGIKLNRSEQSESGWEVTLIDS